MKVNTLPQSSAQNQRGAVLIISIILILALTIIVLGMFNLNTTQTSVATNSADSQTAFQTADGALRQAENQIQSGAITQSQFFATTPVPGLYIFDATVAPRWTTVNWSSATAVISSFQGKSSAPAGVIIESLPSFIAKGDTPQTPTLVYRITARAVGANGGVPVILQSTVQLRE